MFGVYLAGSQSCPEKDEWRNEFDWHASKLHMPVKTFNPLKTDITNGDTRFQRDIWSINQADILVAYANRTHVTTGTARNDHRYLSRETSALSVRTVARHTVLQMEASIRSSGT